MLHPAGAPSSPAAVRNRGPHSAGGASLALWSLEPPSRKEAAEIILIGEAEIKTISSSYGIGMRSLNYWA